MALPVIPAAGGAAAGGAAAGGGGMGTAGAIAAGGGSLAAIIKALWGPGGIFADEPDYQGGSAIGRPEWWKQQQGLGEMRDWSNQFAQDITPEYQGHLQNAISGNMGLSPEMLQMMGGRVKQQMAPQFAMQQDTMQSSFNPRLAGSGAMASAMQKLLSGQGQQMTGAQTDINIQDLFARTGAQRQALGQYGTLWSDAQGASLGRENAILRWLGQ